MSDHKEGSNAALSVEAQPVVKPLEWRDNTKGGVYAYTMIGTFAAIWHGGEFYWACHEGKTVDHIHHKTLEAAKAAAQADYSARILSAISVCAKNARTATPPAPAASEPVGGQPWGWVIPRGGKKKPVIMDATVFDEASAAADADIHDLGYFPLYTHPAPAPAGEWRTMETMPDDDTMVEVRRKNEPPRVYKKTAAKARQDAGGFIDLLEYRLAAAPTPKEGNANG